MKKRKWFNKGLYSAFLVLLILFGSFAITGCTSTGDGTSIVNNNDDDDDKNDGIIIDQPGEENKETLTATIRWTSYGVPHIKGKDFKSVAFGQGYAFAKDGLCIFADQIIKVRSERSLYFRAGENNKNINSDFGYKALNVYQDAVDNFDKLAKDEQDVLKAYAAGYNKYLEDADPEEMNPLCKDAIWVKPIDEIDLLAYYLSISLLASGEQMISYIIDAAPPTATRSATGISNEKEPDATDLDELSKLPNFKHLPFGSNGWGIGKDMTETGRGALLANPHFPHYGPLRFYESHLTIPGEVNIHGGSLYGIPGILMGFNEHVAWTHTVADSSHFTLYKLELEEGYPTSYKYDGEIRHMTHREITIRVRQEDDSYKEESRTIYSSHYGLMFEFSPVLNWNHKTAYTIKDANKHNYEIISQWIAMDRAKNLAEFKDAFKTQNGIPWVNTMYADDQGNAFYIDGTRVPNLSDETLREFKESLKNDLLLSTMYNMGIMMLDGSDSKNEWQGDIGPGLVPYDKAPKLERTDFVANSNDSHWLTNPHAPLEGYSMLFGPEKTARSLRTRMGLKLLDEVDDDGFSSDEIRDALLSDRVYLGELIYDDLIDRCQAKGSDPVALDTGESIDISGACNALQLWDGTVRLESVAAHVFREFGSHFKHSLFAESFNHSNPATTPCGLKVAPTTGEDPVLQSLAKAVSDIEKAGIDLKAELGDIQFTYRGEEKIPLHGGSAGNGVFNPFGYSPPNSPFGNRTLLPMRSVEGMINSGTGLHSNVDTQGYYYNYGTSFVFTMEFTDNGPKAQGLITYSQSSNSLSPHFSDQTRLFSESEFRPLLFTEEEVAADTKGEPVVITMEFTN